MSTNLVTTKSMSTAPSSSLGTTKKTSGTPKKDHLSKDQHTLLNVLQQSISKLDKISTDAIQSTYHEMNNIIKQHVSNNGHFYDMNHILAKKGHNNIDKLRSFIKTKNKRDYLAVSPLKWKKYYNNIHKCLQADGLMNISRKSIQECIFELWKTYLYNWAGFWTVIQTNGKLHQAVDANDWAFIKRYFERKIS